MGQVALIACSEADRKKQLQEFHTDIAYVLLNYFCSFFDKHGLELPNIISDVLRKSLCNFQVNSVIETKFMSWR